MVTLFAVVQLASLKELASSGSESAQLHAWLASTGTETEFRALGNEIAPVKLPVLLLETVTGAPFHVTEVTADGA